LNFDIITELDGYRALRDEIETILADFPDSFFYSPSWLIPFQRVLSGDREVMHIIGRDRDGSITGSVDLSVVRTPFLKIFHPRVLAFLGTRSVVSPEHLDFAIKRRSREEWFDFLGRYIRNEFRSCVFAVFDSVAEGAKNVIDCMAYFGDNGFRVIRETQDVCPYFDLPDDFDVLLEGYSHNMRKNIRRTMKRCRDKTRLIDGSELGNIEDILREARRLHTLSRELKGDAGSFARRGYIEFHRELARSVGERASLYAKFLVTGKKPIAFRYGFIVNGVYYDYQTGYDPAFAELRPGFAALTTVVQDLIGCGVRRFDFLRGDEPYKRHWAMRDRKTNRYYVFPPGLKANIYADVWRMYHGVKRNGR
jgi:hypothetical protein